MNFSPCLDIFFKNLPFTKRVEAVSSLGYKYYEFWTWWDKNLDEIAEVSTDYRGANADPEWTQSAKP